MRINLSQVNAHLINELQASGAIAGIRHDGGDVIFVDLPAGEMVAIHLVEREISVKDIADTFKYNTDLNAFTLFILSAPMLLPDDGMLYRPYDWMTALLDIYGDKIYGFETIHNRVYIFPVCYDPPENGIKRLVHWGDSIETAQIGVGTVYTEGRILNGRWRIADFDSPTQRQARDDAAKTAGGVYHAASGRYYEILGIVQGADAEAIRKAYHTLARQFHPDLNKTEEATARMQEINTAYAILMQELGEESSEESSE